MFARVYVYLPIYGYLKLSHTLMLISFAFSFTDHDGTSPQSLLSFCTPQASDRIKRRRRRQRQRVLSDHARLRAAADAADTIHRAVSQRLQLYRAELPAAFAGGHDTLARIGELSASRCCVLCYALCFF